jgi:glucosyl-dolichyl phosphate glucuronosyltransferase
MARICAVVCTHNQGRYLGASLASLVSQELASDQFGVVVVDNASSDQTRQVVEEFRDAGNLRYVYEPRLGLSHARNTGWQEARAELVAYLDADAIAAPSWLSAIVDRFDAGGRALAAVGGRIEPIWEAPRPAWFGANLGPFVGAIDWSAEPMLLREADTFLAGSNVAYARRTLCEMGGFFTALGRRGRSLLSNEEILLQRRLLRRGMHMLYDPAIRVRHHVRPECVTRRWLRRRLYWQGISDAILERELAVASALPWPGAGLLRQDVRELLRACRSYCRAVGRGAQGTTNAECGVCLAVGRLLGDARLRTKHP